MLAEKAFDKELTPSYSGNHSKTGDFAGFTGVARQVAVTLQRR